MRSLTAHAEVLDIEEHMLHFLENHDEQRIASTELCRRPEQSEAGDGRVCTAQPVTDNALLWPGRRRTTGTAMRVSMSSTRTTIFDYWGVPAHQRWMNDGKFTTAGN